MTTHILILNWNGKDDTVTCIRSILKSSTTPTSATTTPSELANFTIHLLDNGSKDKNELNTIKNHFKNTDKIKYYKSKKNLGFAGGNNFLLKRVIPKYCKGTTEKDTSNTKNTRETNQILFLNNDTILHENFLSTLPKNKDMVAFLTMQMDDITETSNMGLSIYKTGLATNRTGQKHNTLIGPSGNCALYSVKCLKKIQQKTGYYFDPAYFCYAEDADLALRAILLGFEPTYTERPICYHKVSASTGGHFNKFIMYHTLRNTLFNIVKNFPLPLLLRYSPYIIGFQFAVFFRYLPTRRFPTVLKIYQSFFKTLPSLLKKRRRIQETRTTTTKHLRKYFTKRIYN